MRTKFRHWTIAVAVAALATAAAAQTGRPKLIKNSVKYSDVGSHAVTKRAGVALLTGRALVNKDLSVDLELATPAPGNIAKVQLKPLDNAGKATFVTNWDGLSGSYFHQTVTGIARGQSLQVQANLTGFDNGTDVVTLNGVNAIIAALRPDLQVSGISPSTGTANAPVNIKAVVQELNGDTGARANCVLYINDTKTDQASAIWVDAGETVSCMFTHVFATPGTYNLKVAAENVTPGDYDTSNNSATATINIINPGIPLDYSAQASDYQLNDSSQSTFAEYSSGQLVFFNGTKGSDSGWTQASELDFSKSAQLVFPVSAAVTESTDGSSITLSGNFTNVTADWTWQCGTNCSESTAWRQDGEFQLFLDVKAASDSLGGASSSYSGNVQRMAGDVTYLSANAACTWSADPQCPDDAVYVANAPIENPTGTRLTFGAHDMLQFSMTDAAGTQYSANPVIPLFSSVLQSQQPLTCSDEVISSTLTFRSCSLINKSSVGVAGSVTSPQQ